MFLRLVEKQGSIKNSAESFNYPVFSMHWNFLETLEVPKPETAAKDLLEHYL